MDASLRLANIRGSKGKRLLQLKTQASDLAAHGPNPDSLSAITDEIQLLSGDPDADVSRAACRLLESGLFQRPEAVAGCRGVR